jgi:hypothetical protein
MLTELVSAPHVLSQRMYVGYLSCEIPKQVRDDDIFIFTFQLVVGVITAPQQRLFF